LRVRIICKLRRKNAKAEHSGYLLAEKEGIKDIVRAIIKIRENLKELK